MFELLPQILVNALIAGSIYALVSCGLSLTYGLLRILNFAHGHLMMVGAYVFYCLVVQNQLPIPLAAVITVFAAVLLSYLALQIFVLPFIRYSSMLTFVSTLTLATILESLVSMIFDVNVKSLPAGKAAESFEIYGVYITPIEIIIIASALIFLSVLAFVIHSTSIGRRVRALAEHGPAAESLGISHRRISLAVFAVATVLTVYAGVLVGYETNLQPTMGASYTIKAFAAMVLGGLGNIWGTVIGSYLLGMVENLSVGLDFGDYSLPAGYKDAFAFGIILFVLLFRPQGLFGFKRRVA